MATYFVSASGSNASPYDTWAKAATSLQTALTAATTNGDVVVLQYDGVPTTDAALAADTAYVFGASISVIAASNDGGSAYTPTPMGTSYYIGNPGGTSRQINLQSIYNVYLYGLSFQVAGVLSKHISIGNVTAADGAAFTLESCRVEQKSSNSGATIYMGSRAVNNYNSAVSLRNSVIELGDTAKKVTISSLCKIEGGSIVGSSASQLFEASVQDPGGARLECHGVNMSSQSGAIVGSNTSTALSAVFVQCVFGAGFSPFTATPPHPSLASGDALYLDCSSGNEQYHLIYANALGTLTTDTGIYANDGAKYDGTNGCSWKIVTSADASRQTPFVTPWVSKYNDGTSAITPRIEILRNGSATAFTDGEVWGEWSVKATASSTLASLYSDRTAVGASAAAQATGAGLSGWTGESGTAWSGKLEPVSTVTPAVIGDIGARVCVGAPSVTVYVDPTIRGV